MATIHLMNGFIGFGKTTIAKKLEKTIPAVRLTHDEFMVKLYGRDMPYADFHSNYQKVDMMLWDLAKDMINANTNVIMDYGFWSHEIRKKVYEQATQITPSVIFHSVCCDIDLAKKRVLTRTQNDANALVINENEFNTLLQKYEPWSDADNYPVILHNAQTTAYIGKTVPIKIDRPKGSTHPKYGFTYPLNYGYVPYTKSGDGEELDAYVLSSNEPLEEYVGQCIGVIHRTNDDDDKLIIAPENTNLTDAEIEEQVAFQEKWFEHILIRKNPKP